MFCCDKEFVLSNGKSCEEDECIHAYCGHPNEVEVISGPTSELVASDRSLAQGSDEQENPLGEYPL